MSRQPGIPALLRKRISRRATFDWLTRAEGYVADLEIGGWLNAFLLTDATTTSEHVIWQQVGHGPLEWRVDLHDVRYPSYAAAAQAVTAIFAERSAMIQRLLTPLSPEEHRELDAWLESRAPAAVAVAPDLPEMIVIRDVAPAVLHRLDDGTWAITVQIDTVTLHQTLTAAQGQQLVMRWRQTVQR